MYQTDDGSGECRREWVENRPIEAGVIVIQVPVGISPLPGELAVSNEETKLERWARMVVGYAILGSFMVVANWYTNGLSLVEKSQRLRDSNETRAIQWVGGDSSEACRKVPVGSSAVRAQDLARAYHESRRSADLTYTGQMVTVPVRQFSTSGREIRWYLGSQDLPAMVILELAEGAEVPAVPSGKVLWVTGVCQGRKDDDVGREMDGYRFHVLVTGCKIAKE